MLHDNQKLFSYKWWYWGTSLWKEVHKIHFFRPASLTSFYLPHTPSFSTTKLNKLLLTRLRSNFTYTFSARIIEEETWKSYESQKFQSSPTCVPKLAAIMWVRSLAANMAYLAQKIWERTARQKPVGTKKSTCGFMIHEQTIAKGKSLEWLKS